MDVRLRPFAAVEPRQHAAGRILFGAIGRVALLAREQECRTLIVHGLRFLHQRQVELEIVRKGWADHAVNQRITFFPKRDPGPEKGR